MEAVTNTNLKSQFLETELIWVIHRSHRAYDWRDIISSEDSTLVRITTNNYYMLSLCMKCISIELFDTKSSSSLFANCDLLYPFHVPWTVSNRQTTYYIQNIKETEKMPCLHKEESQPPFFFLLESQDSNVPSF